MERFEVLGVPFSLQLWVRPLPYPSYSNTGHWTLGFVSLAQVGHCRTREVQMHRFHVLQRRSGWGFIQQESGQKLRKTLDSWVFCFSCDHRIWCQRYWLFFPRQVSIFILSRPFSRLTVCVKLPLPVCRQWLEDSLKENDPTAVQLFLVGTKKDLSVRLNNI